MRRLYAVLFLWLVAFSAWAQPVQQAQHIKEIVQAKDQETLWTFLLRFPSSFEAQVYYGLILSALAGLLASWAYKWSQGQADGFKHFSPKYVVQQFLWLNGITLTLIMTTGFTTDSGEFFGWMSVLSSGALSGWAGEVKVAWTPQQRAQNGANGG